MPKERFGRLDFVQDMAATRAWTAVKRATEQQDELTPAQIALEQNCFQGQTAVVIGSGVGGLTTAYELLAQSTGVNVIVLEANERTGGRCLTLRPGDVLVEDKNSRLFDSEPGQPQTVTFEQPAGDSEPYLNAGPGRIPSSHKRLLHYLKKFGVDIEVYVMNSGANMTQMEGGPFEGEPMVNRRLVYNTNGWLAQTVFQNANSLIESLYPEASDAEHCNLATKLRSLMVTFGGLNEEGCYTPEANPDGQDETSSDRAGYTVLPGVHGGTVAKALKWRDLLDSEFWAKTRIYQPMDFLWQPTLFQPVGGMDHVQRAFAENVRELGGDIRLACPVTSIDWDESQQKFVITYTNKATGSEEVLHADVCFSNAAIPFLSEILSDRLQSTENDSGLTTEFKQALDAVYEAQFNPQYKRDASGYTPRFLACTTKVGWQAERYLWQGSEFGQVASEFTDAEGGNLDRITVPTSEYGVVPIFGGISWTDHAITQIWYPSTAYHDQLGTLTGCYNFSQNAFQMGRLPFEERLDIARDGASNFGQAFADGLQHGLAIAWQNMPHIKGGWGQWHLVGNTTEESVCHFNELIQGSGIDGDPNPKFFIVGDQLSSLPGWQEGAIASALNAIGRYYKPEVAVPHMKSLPDTRLMVEGV